MSGNIIDINSRPIASDKQRALNILEIVAHSKNRSDALRRMAKMQVGMPTQIRMELAACAVTIEVLKEELGKVKESEKQTEDLLTSAQELIKQQEEQLIDLRDRLNRPCMSCGE